MSIFEEVTRQMAAAMRAKQKERLNALRSIRASFQLATKEDGSDSLPDERCVALLRRLEKQRRESIAAFEQVGRADRAAAEQAELEIIQGFLPSLADEAKTRAWVQQAIAECGASQPADVGRVMGALMKAHKGEVDGALAKRVAAELLSPPE